MLEPISSSPAVYTETFAQRRDEVPERLSLSYFFDVFRKRWIALMICIEITLGLAAIYIAITPKKYAAVTTLLIDSRLAQLSQTDASATVVDQAAVESQIELLRSDKMLSSVIAKLGLMSDSEFVGAATTDVPVKADVAQQRAIAVLASNLWVYRVGRSYLVSVTYNSPNPTKAARVANEIASAYISDQIGAKVQTAKDQNSWLEAQVNETRSRVARSHLSVEEFKAISKNDSFVDYKVQQELNRLSDQAAHARTATIAVRTKLDSAEATLLEITRGDGRSLDENKLHAFADPDLDHDASRFVSLVARLQFGSPPVGDDSAIELLQAEKAAVLDDIKARISSVASQQRADWVAATTNQQAAETALADMRFRDTRSRLVEERLRELETEAATSRSLYESYLNQLTHAAQQQPVPASDTRVISPAATPLSPSTPKKLLTFVLAGMSGVALGLAVTFMIENLDDVIRTRKQVESATEMPCIGIVPRIRRRRKRSAHVASPERLRDGVPFFNLSGSHSNAVDSLRSLQLAAYNVESTMGASILGVTSAVAGEGKTTIAYNLALSARNAGRRVLLVDCNLRNPTLTTMVLPEGSGLAPMFELEERVFEREGFDIVPASAQLTIGGAELPDAGLLELLLAEARTRYDLVIVDFPAILPLSEVIAVVPQVDILVLVTRWGSTTMSQLRRALDRIADGNRRIAVLLNLVRPRKLRQFEGSTRHQYAD